MESPPPKPAEKTAISVSRILQLLVLIPLLVIGLMAAGVGLLFLRSDVSSFQPRIPQIRQRIEAQRASTPVLPPFLVQCLHSEGAPDHFVARCLLMQYGLGNTTALRWHVRTWFWSWSLKLHFSTAEQDFLHCACLNDGTGKTGIHHLCTRLYGRSIEELTEPELAALVVASRSPSRFLKNPELLARFSAELLRRVKAS